MFARRRLYRLGFLAFSLLLGTTFAAKVKEATAPMGHGLYVQKGANSCLYCHGVDGQNGSVKAAADLAQPKTWKIYKVLGGDAALAKDKAGFLAKMEEATVNLILKGAIAHNSSFKKDWFDLKSVGPYNAQMVGLAGSPSQKWVKKYKKKRGVTPEMAAKAVYLYLVGLDKQKVF